MSLIDAQEIKVALPARPPTPCDSHAWYTMGKQQPAYIFGSTTGQSSGAHCRASDAMGLLGIKESSFPGVVGMRLVAGQESRDFQEGQRYYRLCG
jgi:hypothetical protein